MLNVSVVDFTTLQYADPEWGGFEAIVTFLRRPFSLIN